MNSFISLCYHYIRPSVEKGLYPRLLGTSESEFERHLDFFNDHYSFLSEAELNPFFSGELSVPKTGMLITFDDGLTDHFIAGKLLAKRGISALFFIPTCILEGEPANPTIIHYVLAKARIKGFLKAYKAGLQEFALSDPGLLIKQAKKADAWKTIAQIKYIFKYRLSYVKARQLLLYIFAAVFGAKATTIFKQMHLSQKQLKKLVQMGHTLGTHTHSHISVAASKLTQKQLTKELLYPRQILQSIVGTRVSAMSYPFGEPQDCLSTSEFLKATQKYRYAFTVAPHYNVASTSQFEIGRYMPMSSDTVQDLQNVFATMRK